MASVVVTVKLMPDSPEIDLSEITKKAQKLIAPQQKAVPGLQLLGVAEPRRVGLGGIPVSGAVAPSITPTGAPRLTNGVPPIANIIQITVR